MKQKLFFLFVIANCYACLAQPQPTVYLNDGTEIIGHKYSFTEGKLKLYKEKDSRPMYYEHDQFDKVKVIYANSRIAYFKQVKIAGKKRGLIMELRKEGKVNLYEVAKTNSQGNYRDYYVKRKSEAGAIFIASDNMFSISKRFKKKAPNYFKDCPALVKQLANNNFAQRQMPTIVEFYNTNCGSDSK